MIIIIINNNNSNISIKHQMQNPTDDDFVSDSHQKTALPDDDLVPLLSAASPSFSTASPRFVQMMNNYGATVLVPEVDSDLEVVLGKAFF